MAIERGSDYSRLCHGDEVEERIIIKSSSLVIRQQCLADISQIHNRLTAFLSFTSLQDN